MMKSLGKLYGAKRKPILQKEPRIDRRKTRLYPDILDDSDEGSYGSTTSVSSESEFHSSDAGSDSSEYSNRRRDSDEDESDSDQKSGASKRKRKRSSANAAALSSSDSDSSVGGEPLRKVLQRKRLRLPDSEDEAIERKKREAEVKKIAAKRKERQSKLLELSQKRKSGNNRRRRRTLGSEEEEEDKADKVKDKKKDGRKESESSSSEEEEAPAPLNSSEEEEQADNDSLKDFIVDEEEGKTDGVEGEKDEKDFLSCLPREFITGSQLTHFQVVVKALLINVLDDTFLKSLYGGERTKRYAQEMKTSLLHFDERLVLPRLENLKQRSRWKERYKERVECYPRVRVMMTGVRSKGCEACELHRTGRFCVRLSGQLYHSNTLQEDKFMPDDTQNFFVGSVCASRTEVYHALKHFKFHLFERCRMALQKHRGEVPEEEEEKKPGKEGQEEEEEEEEEEPVKDTVNKVFTKLQDGGWITEQYEKFQEHLNAADFFQEEKLD